MNAPTDVTDKTLATAAHQEPVTGGSLKRPCPRCGRPFFTLVKLHGDRGGPEMCMECGWEVLEQGNAKRNRLTARYDSILGAFGIEGSSAEAGPNEVSRELLDDVLRLVHPDLHTPARRELATRVSAEVARLRPRAKLRAKPKPPPVYRDASADNARGDNGKASRLVAEAAEHPCTWLAPLHYCHACREKWEKAQEAERERTAVRRRAARQSRRYRDLRHRHCVVCEAPVPVSVRKDARTCSPGCRQRAYRQRRRSP